MSARADARDVQLLVKDARTQTLERLDHVEVNDGGAVAVLACPECARICRLPMASTAAPPAGAKQRCPIARFDREFSPFTTRGNPGAPGAPAGYRFDYLLVVARTRSE